MGQYNKVSIATIAGSVVTILSVVFSLSTEVQGALTTIFTAVGVWAVPNK